jgi:hypothetical protein
MKDKIVPYSEGMSTIVEVAMNNPIMKTFIFVMGSLASVSAYGMLVGVQYVFNTDLRGAVIGCAIFNSASAALIMLVQRMVSRMVSPQISVKHMYQTWYGEKMTISNYISRMLHFMGIFGFSGLCAGLGVVYYFWGTAAVSGVIATALLTTPMIFVSIWIACKK